MVSIDDPSIIYADAEEIAAMRNQEQRRVRLYLAPLASCEDIANSTSNSSPLVMTKTRRSSNRPDLNDDFESDSPRRTLLPNDRSELRNSDCEMNDTADTPQKIILPTDR